MTNNELLRIGPELDLVTWGTIIADSNYFGCNQPQAIVKVAMGRDLGISDSAALTGIHIIKGKPEIGANLIAAQIKRSPKYNYKIVEKTAQRCAIEFFEISLDGKRWESCGIEEFSIEDAKNAYLSFKKIDEAIASHKKGVNFSPGSSWDKFPKDMLRARCLSAGYRAYCPDVFNTPVYAEGEISETIIDAKARVLKAEDDDFEDTKPPKKEPIDPNVILNKNGIAFASPVTVIKKGCVPFYQEEWDGQTLQACEAWQDEVLSHSFDLLSSLQKPYYNTAKTLFDRRAKDEPAQEKMSFSYTFFDKLAKDGVDVVEFFTDLLKDLGMSVDGEYDSLATVLNAINGMVKKDFLVIEEFCRENLEGVRESH